MPMSTIIIASKQTTILQSKKIRMKIQEILFSNFPYLNKSFRIDSLSMLIIRLEGHINLKTGHNKNMK